MTTTCLMGERVRPLARSSSPAPMMLGATGSACAARPCAAAWITLLLGSQPAMVSMADPMANHSNVRLCIFASCCGAGQGLRLGLRRDWRGVGQRAEEGDDGVDLAVVEARRLAGAAVIGS